MIVNETDLPDTFVQTYIEEHASMLGVFAGSSFQNYANEGSLLARSKYRTPTNVIDEMVLARDLAERDDDVAATIGAMLALAFGDGMEHTHPDDVTEELFNQVASHANLDRVFMELYREFLISAQIITVTAFTTEDFQFTPASSARQRTRSLVAPLIGVMPAELIRIIGNDLFQTGVLAYRPATGSQDSWLKEFFDPRTTPARKAEMRGQDPVLTTMVVEMLEIKDQETPSFVTETADQNFGNSLYRLNPRMVHRTAAPKGVWKYPRPFLTRDFGLLEAKRLLNLMDYALLQGGANFLVVAKKGSDLRPAMPAEIENLDQVIRRASRTGVIVGDHRLDIEIITPKLDELLNPAKRKLLGRKIAKALLRLPEYAESDQGGGQAVLADVEILSRVISGDRRQIRRHVENYIYEEVVKRNPTQFANGAAKIWFPKIVLQGLQYFTDLVLKLRDRGDISRRSAVEIAGFDYRAEVEARKRERPDDRIMTPAAVPFSAGGPQDNNAGRPVGSSSNNGSGAPQTVRTPPAATPKRTIARNAGETVRAMWDEQSGNYRIGELTYAILEEYADTREIGRITSFERRALESEVAAREGPITVIPVNMREDLEELKAVRLTTGLSMIVGERYDGAILARALCFREPEFSALDAQERALEWGFDTDPVPKPPLVDRDSSPEPEEAAEEEGDRDMPVIHLHVPGQRPIRVVRDEDGNLIGTEPVEDE